MRPLPKMRSRYERWCGMHELDEAIKRYEEKAEEKRKDYERAVALNIPSEGCLKCAEEYEQVAEWLTELKQLREKQSHIVQLVGNQGKMTIDLDKKPIV